MIAATTAPPPRVENRRRIDPHPGCLGRFGAAFLAVCDTVARTALAPAEIPVGVITAMLGGPFFIWLLRSKRRSLWL